VPPVSQGCWVAGILAGGCAEDKGRAALDALSLMPAALPGIVVGVGLILLWNQRFWPVSPYNTWVILLLSYCCLLLPWPVRYVGSAAPAGW
jgi:iron(III) transport system permease protein